MTKGQQPSVRIPRVWARACEDIVCAYLAEDAARFVKPLLREPSPFELAALDDHLKTRRASLRRGARRCVEQARDLYRTEHRGVACESKRCRHYAILAVAAAKAAKKATFEEDGLVALMDVQARANRLFYISKKIINEYLDARN